MNGATTRNRAAREVWCHQYRLRVRRAEDPAVGRLAKACIETGQRFVVDNTNPTRAEREVYHRAAKAAGFRVVGYYFQSRVEDCKRRNAQRHPDQQVPLRGILGTAGRMELPTRTEGFEDLYYVRIDEASRFVIEEWVRRGAPAQIQALTSTLICPPSTFN